MTYTYDEMIFSDLHKDAYGFRPSLSHSFYSATSNEKQMMWDRMIIDLDASLDEEKKKQEQAWERFNNKLDEIIAVGAADRSMALRWLIDGQFTEQELKFYGAGIVCHKFDLSYSKENEIARLLGLKIKNND